MNVTSKTKETAVRQALSELEHRIKEKGDRAFISDHEALGVIAEEYDELLEAVRSNDPEKVMHELRDVIVGALWGIASILTRMKEKP